MHIDIFLANLPRGVKYINKHVPIKFNTSLPSIMHFYASKLVIKVIVCIVFVINQINSVPVNNNTVK